MRFWLSLSVTFFLNLLPILLFAAGASPALDPAGIKHIVVGFPHQTNYADNLYPTRLLRAALKASGVAFSLGTAPLEMSQDRNLREIALGNNVDVFWTMTNTERESKLRPIRIPIDKGLYGWRLLLIRQNDRALDMVKGIPDFKNFVFLQGHDWPDTEILRANKLRVVTSDSYQQLFSMIYKSRADILPRSILEVSAEQEQYHHKLKVHPTISIYYPTALYYFVKKGNEELASWIETGLNRLICSGEFERLFQEEFGDDIQRAKSAKRLVIKLTNPYLPANTPFNRPELWYFNQNIAKSD